MSPLETQTMDDDDDDLREEGHRLEAPGERSGRMNHVNEDENVGDNNISNNNQAEEGGENENGILDEEKNNTVPGLPIPRPSGGRRSTHLSFQDAGAKVEDDVRDQREHEEFLARREHFKSKRNAPKKSASTVARGAVKILCVDGAGFFLAWRDFVRARMEDAKEMSAISHCTKVLKKQPWRRTPREIDSLRRFMCDASPFIQSLNLRQQRQVCKVATPLELPSEHVVCETGDVGDAFYIVLRGCLSIWHGTAPKHGEAWDEAARIGKRMEAGDTFGELALQEDRGIRSVTVRTEGPTVLAVLSKRNYLLTVQNVFEQTTRDRVDYLCRVPALQHESLARLRTLALYLTEMSYQPGEEIIGQHSPPRVMFFITSGAVDVRISMNAELEKQMSKRMRGMWKGGMVSGRLMSRKGRLSLVEPAVDRTGSGLGSGGESRHQQQQKQSTSSSSSSSSSSLPQMTSMGGIHADRAWQGARTKPAAKSYEWMCLGMLGVGNHIGERALCMKRRHTYGAIARTPCTLLMLPYSGFKLRLSDKTHELMLSLAPKMPTVESVHNTVQQDERWRNRRIGIVEEELAAIEMVRKPGAAFVVPERSVLGKPGFGPGAMAGDAAVFKNNDIVNRGEGVARSHASPPSVPLLRKGGLLPSLREDEEEPSSSSSMPSPSSAEVTRTTRDRGGRDGGGRGRNARTSRNGSRSANGSKGGRGGGEEEEEVQPSSIIAAATTAMVNAAIAEYSETTGEDYVSATDPAAVASSPKSARFSLGFGSRRRMQDSSSSTSSSLSPSLTPSSSSMKSALSPELKAKLSTSPATRALEELAAKAEEKASTASFRGGEIQLDETYVEFLPECPFLSVLLEDENAGKLLAMETFDELFQAWVEEAKQRKMKCVRYAHNRCMVYDPRMTVTPTEEEKREAAGEMAEMVLNMRDDVAEMANMGELARLRINIMSAVKNQGGAASLSSSSNGNERNDGRGHNVNDYRPTEAIRYRRESTMSDGKNSKGGDGGDSHNDDNDDGESVRSSSTSSTVRQLRQVSGTISGKRAAMWAGLSFGNLFVTYAANGTFVAAFSGTAAEAAEDMLREAYASTDGPPGMQDDTVDDHVVGGEIRADFKFADQLPSNVLLREMPPASSSPPPPPPPPPLMMKKVDEDNTGGASLKDEEDEAEQVGPPRATMRVSPYLMAIEQRLNQVQDRAGNSRVDSDSILGTMKECAPSAGGGKRVGDAGYESPTDYWRLNSLTPSDPTFVVLEKRQVYRDPYRKRGWAKLRTLRPMLVALSDLIEDVKTNRKRRVSEGKARGVKLKFGPAKGSMVVAAATETVIRRMKDSVGGVAVETRGRTKINGNDVDDVDDVDDDDDDARRGSWKEKKNKTRSRSTKTTNSSKLEDVVMMSAASAYATRAVGGRRDSSRCGPTGQMLLPPMRTSRDGGELQPCNSARSLASGRGGGGQGSSARQHVHGSRRSRIRILSAVPGVGTGAGARAGTGTGTEATHLGGMLGAAAAKRPRPQMRRQRSAAAERFLPQIFNNKQETTATAPSSGSGGGVAKSTDSTTGAALKRIFSARFAAEAPASVDPPHRARLSVQHTGTQET